MGNFGTYLGPSHISRAFVVTGTKLLGTAITGGATPVFFYALEFATPRRGLVNVGFSGSFTKTTTGRVIFHFTLDGEVIVTGGGYTGFTNGTFALSMTNGYATNATQILPVLCEGGQHRLEMWACVTPGSAAAYGCLIAYGEGL